MRCLTNNQTNRTHDKDPRSGGRTQAPRPAAQRVDSFLGSCRRDQFRCPRQGLLSLHDREHRISRAPVAGAVALLASMAGFAMGVYLSTRIVKPSAGSGMWPQRVTVALGVSLIAHAVFQVVWFANDGQPSIQVAHALLDLWALAMGIQSAAVRTLHVEGVFTTAATATIIVLVGHLTNWSATGAERRRLAGVLVSLFAGATAGGLLLVHAPIYAPVLPFLITVVAVATAAIVLRERRKSPEP
jgi:uncharacterized membrane protein YoaK (UPF0700 family)